MATASLDRSHQARQAILWNFRDDVPTDLAPLVGLSPGEWRKLLFWLDTTGLALYFFNRVSELAQSDVLPPEVLARLRQNLEDNKARTAAMIAESAAIHRSFQSAGLFYATLKGYSLSPLSVPKVELRSQLDLDFLIAESSAPEARRILEARGYRLRAVSGKSWEFKADGSDVRSLKDHYKAASRPCVELHLEKIDVNADGLLSRAQKVWFRGICMPVLAPVDLLLGQGMHLYKHICGEHFRAAHLLEFRRNVLAHYEDQLFWGELRELAESSPIACAGLGVATLLVSRSIGNFAPPAFTCWTVDRLSTAARLWVEQYGCRTALSGFPGNKSYLLLQREMEKLGMPAKRSRLRALMPRRLPPPIEHKTPDETVNDQIGRYYRQLRYILFRLYFHGVEGLRYLRASTKWKKTLTRLSLHSATRDAHVPRRQYGGFGSGS